MKDIGELLRSLHNCKCGNCSECQYRTGKHTYGPFGCTTRVMKDAEEAICELSVSCKEWKERGDALEKTLNAAFADFAKSYARLFAYEDAEEHGRLVMLPCKAGDMLYAPTLERIVAFTAAEIRITKNGWYIVDNCKVKWGMSDFGKVFFATREEAEARLREVEHD